MDQFRDNSAISEQWITFLKRMWTWKVHLLLESYVPEALIFSPLCFGANIFFLLSTMDRLFEPCEVCDFWVWFWGHSAPFWNGLEQEASITIRITGIIDNGWKVEVVYGSSGKEDSKKIYCLFLKALVANIESKCQYYLK